MFSTGPAHRPVKGGHPPSSLNYVVEEEETARRYFITERQHNIGVRLQRVAQTGTPLAAGAAASRMAVVDMDEVPSVAVVAAIRSWLVLVMSLPTLFTRSKPATCPSRTGPA